MDQPPHANGSVQGASDTNAGAPAAERVPKRESPFVRLPLTSLVGRNRELEEILSLLSSAQVRLLTLTGPGGVGKTRLALQVAARSHKIFSNGAYFVPLAAVNNADLVLPTVAQTLGVRELAGKPLLDSLCDALRVKHLLLILDNFEQIVAAAPQVVDLLTCAPRLSVLITSRAALHVYGVHEYPVAPLNLPDVSRQETIEQLTQYEAVRLFIERARAAKPMFSVNNRNAPAVAEICHRLDGLPLAIELAAARTKLLSPQALLQRIDRRLPLLTGGPDNFPHRHQTLRNAIAWSYDLLTEREKALFRGLSVFSGGCTLEAATAVCSPLDGDESRPGVESERTQLEALGAIADQSLLRQDEQEDGEPRFSMLQTIREFALDELSASQDEQAVRERHAQFFLELAERAAQELAGADQAEWLDALEREHDNLRAALLYAQQGRDGEMGLRIGTALWRFWYIRGHISEGRKWLSEALEFSAEVTPALRAKALNGLGNLAGAQSDYDSARHYHTLSFELAAAIGDKVGMARALGNIANTERLLGDYDHAMSTFEQVVPLLREVGDKRNIALCLRNMGIIASGQGDSTKAQQLSQEALSIQRELGDKQSIATTLNGLGMMAVREGEYKAARAYSEECLELFRELGDRGGEARALYDMAQVVAEEGDYNTARSLLSEGLRIRYQQGTKRGVADSMRALAVVEKEQADPGRLVRLLAASEALSLALGVPISERERQRYEPWLERARTMLGPEEFDAAWGEGKALTIEKAVALALEELPTQAARTPLKNESSTPAPRPDSGLTQREIEVLRLVAAGLTNPGIASHLHVSINTVQTHLRSIFNKIDVKTRGAAVRYAFEHGLS